MATLEPLDLIKSKLPSHRKAGSGFVCRCPSHDDHNASLSFTAGDDGRVLMKCHAGCDVNAICSAIGIKVSDLMPKGDLFTPKTKPTKKRIAATYDYLDEEGNLLFQAVRYEPKDFAQRRRGPDGEWQYRLGECRRVLYRLPQIIKHDKSKAIFVVEGEKDSDNLARFGILATSSPMGAGKWLPEYAEYLRDFSVIILPDNDRKGWEHAITVWESLQGVAKSVKIIDLPELAEKGDVSDFLMLLGGNPSSEDVREALKSAIKTREVSVDQLRDRIADSIKSTTAKQEAKEHQSDDGPTSTTLDAAIGEYLEVIRSGLPTKKPSGIHELDSALQGGGLPTVGMITVAGRPGHGKSAVAGQAAHNWTLTEPGVFITEEMPRSDVAKRSIQFLSGVPEEYWSVKEEELRKDIDLYLAQRKPLYLVERCVHVNTVCDQISRHVQEKDCRFGIVDYAQLFQAEGNNRYEKTTNISLALKRCSLKNNIPLIVLCQMSRDIERRDTFVPRMSDLRESGQFDQDSDAIIFVVWPWKIDSKKPPKEYTLYIAKNKNGGIIRPVVNATFNPFRQRVESLPVTSRENYEPSFDDYGSVEDFT